MKYIDLVVTTESGGFHPVDEIIAESKEVTRGKVNYINLLHDDTIMSLYTMEGEGDEMKRELDRHSDVLSYDVFDVDEDEYHVYVHVDRGEPVTNVLSLIEELRIIIDTPMEFTDEGLKVRAIAEQGTLNEALGKVPEEIDFEIKKVGEYSSGEEGLLSVLTQKQRSVLETAVAMGYYEVPRGADYKEIAEEVGVAASTASEHLRKAESKLITSLLE
ncbi:MAG: helix-turn-helix domain-containing protein [Halobacteria archaeon]